MSNPHSDALLAGVFQRVSWPVAAIGIVLSCATALSIHVVMLEALHVPYPKGYPTIGWSAFCGTALSAYALSWIYTLAEDRLFVLSAFQRIALFAALTAMLREAFRVTLLDGVVTTAWSYSLLSDSPRFAVSIALAALVILIRPRFTHPIKRLLSALITSATITYVLMPMFLSLLGKALAHYSYLEHTEVYTRGWRLEIPAYITFLEPTLAAFLLSALVWDRLSAVRAIRTVQFICLIMAINTSLIRLPLYPLFSPFPVRLALLSMSQFFLEWLVLSLSIIATWRASHYRKTCP